MAALVEVYYEGPRDEARERALLAEVRRFGGEVEFVCEPDELLHAVRIAYKFADYETADRAADHLRSQPRLVKRERGEKVWGPASYGDE